MKFPHRVLMTLAALVVASACSDGPSKPSIDASGAGGLNSGAAGTGGIHASAGADAAGGRDGGGGGTTPVTGEAPVIHSFSASPPALATGASAMLQVNASDSDNDPLSYAFSLLEGMGRLEGDDTATGKSYVAPGVPETARIRVTVADDNGGSATSILAIDVTEPEVAPVTPSLVMASDGTFVQHVEVTWTAVDGAQTYYVQRATSETGPFTDLQSTSAPALEDAGAEHGVYYWYRVRAVNSIGASDYSEVNSGYRGLALASPSASAEIGAPVTVTWERVDGAQECQLLEQIVGDDEQVVCAWDASVSGSCTDTAFEFGVTASYVVECRNDITISRSDAVEATPSFASQDLTVRDEDAYQTYGGKTFISISWSAMDDASGYGVYRATAAAGPYTLVASPTSSAYLDLNLADATRYFYKVQASHSTYGAGERVGAEWALSLDAFDPSDDKWYWDTCDSWTDSAAGICRAIGNRDTIGSNESGWGHPYTLVTEDDSDVYYIGMNKNYRYRFYDKTISGRESIGVAKATLYSIVGKELVAASPEGTFTNDTPFSVKPCRAAESIYGKCGQGSVHALALLVVEKADGTERRYGSRVYVVQE